MKRRKLKRFDSTGSLPGIPRSPAQIVSYMPGSSWRCGDERVVIATQLGGDRVLVRFTADDRVESISVGSLVPWPPPGLESAISSRVIRPVAAHSDVVWGRALEEHRIISTMVDAGDISPAARARAAQALAISDRQVRRKITRFLALRSVDAFLPQATGPVRGSAYLHPHTEKVVRDEIQQALKNSPDIGVDDIYPLVLAATKALDLKSPGRGSVNARLQRLRRQTENLPPEIGRELEYLHAPVRGAIRTGGALSVVEMDHTICDVHLVEPQRGLPIGRPVLSLLIDRATRIILGLLLSLEAPSRLSVGLCMHHAVFHKQAWLTDLGLPDACWPGFGLPTAFYTDNAKEFKAESVRRSLQVYGIEQRFRPVGDPAAGGIIERAIGTFMRKVRLLPGTSYSKLLGETPRHADRKGRLSLQELSIYMARQISVYHKTRHDGLGMPPLTAWEQAWVVNGKASLPRIPDCADKFRLAFLPGMYRTVTRAGIELFSLQYQSPDLYPLIEPNSSRMVRYDPRDLSEVFVEGPDAHIRVPLCNQAIGFSLWEWREIRAQQIQAGRSRDPERIAAEIRANRDLIESRSEVKGRWRDARRVARAQEWQRSAVTPVRPIPAAKSPPMKSIPPCTVKE
jgi:putative transposase